MTGSSLQSEADYGQMIDALNRAHYAGETAFYGTAGLRPCEEALLERLEVGARILDVGCGAGRVTKRGAPHGVTAVGIDINHAALLAAADHRPGLCLARARMGSVPFATGVFDQVWCLRFSFNALPTTAERVQTIEELWSACAPGGRVLIEAFNWYFPGRHHLLRLANLVDLAARRLRWLGQGRTGSPPLPARDVIYLANKTATAAPGYAHLTTVRELRRLAHLAGVGDHTRITGEHGIIDGDLAPIRDRHQGYATWLVLTKPVEGRDR